MSDLNDELERLQRENETLRLAYDKQHQFMQRENKELRDELAAQDGWPSDEFLISWRDNEIASLRQQLAEAQGQNETLRLAFNDRVRVIEMQLKDKEELQDALANLRQQLADFAKRLAEAKRDAARYNELLYAVAKKHPDETRHETALRYIRQAEQPKDDQCQAMREGE